MSDEQSTFIKTHKQLIIVVVLAFAIPIALIASLTQLVTDMKPPGKAEADSQLLSRIKPFGEVTIADASSSKGNLTGEQVFQSQCKTCHEPGIAGAPKVGDKAQWAVSIKKGYEALVQHAINGIQEAGKVMPPKGGNPDLSDLEVQRAVVYMANRSGANFNEPPAPAATVSPSTPATTATAAPAAVVPAPSSSTAAAAASAAGVTPAAMTAAPSATAKANGPLDLAAGQALMQKDGCSACHAVDKKIVGPAFQDVAAKYKGDAGAYAKLTQKVKAGGAGVWGPVPMPPNSQVADGDIQALVSWILAPKK
ncbi:MAG TPA: c-type cytochrome [Casimicrobiaceae bacterium]|nr:c-type cytochrome [Casimicrobiaceae bacterium]